MRPKLLTLAACTVVLLAACGSPARPAVADPGLHPGVGQSLAGMPGATGTPTAVPPTMPSMSMPTGATTGAPAVPVAGNAVSILNFAFAPAALTVKAGTTVTWTNKDADSHTVTSTS